MPIDISVSALNPQPYQVVLGNSQGPAGPSGTPGYAGVREILDIAVVGQTVFVLTNSVAPVRQHLTGLFLNGERAAFGRDFMLDGGQVQWLSATITLDPLDHLEIIYYAQTQTT